MDPRLRLLTQRSTMTTRTSGGSSPSRSAGGGGQRHVRNTSEPLYPTDFLAAEITLSLSSDGANTTSPPRPVLPPAPLRPRLSTLERQWSTSDVLHTPGDTFLRSEESPFHQSWAGSHLSVRQRDVMSRSYSLSSAGAWGSPTRRSVSALEGASNDSSGDVATGEESIIHDAARITNWPSVASLCETHPQHASYVGPDGWTALHHACNRRCPHADVVEALLNVYPDALLLEEEKGMTPLHYACRFKAPTDVVRLLLHLYPTRGQAVVSKRDRKGRTPLFYAVRYDAPTGVVEMLLEIDPSAVLEEDRSAESPLVVVWDSWAEKFEGKKTLQPFLTPDPEVSHETLMEQLEAQSKLAKKWKTVNLFLRAAFGFPGVDKKREGMEETRTWRVLHACCAIKCHPTLFQLCMSLYPEQVSQLDERDLYPDVAQETALHLATSSPAYGETGRVILTSLLDMFPEAAHIPDSKDGSLPLHRVVENERKSHWTLEGAKDVYDAYPLAPRQPDRRGRLPLHRAAAAHHPMSTIRREEGGGADVVDDEDDDNSASIICNLVAAYPEAAAYSDHDGRLPLHVVAEQGEVWNAEAEAIYQAYETSVRVRAGARLHRRLPIHLAAASPDTRRSLVERLVELHPLGATQPDALGKLPLHLACESGKMWDKGVSAIYNAFPNAIRQPEGNSRRWYALTMAAASPNASSTLIQELARLHPDAAAETDDQRRYPLHWACASGKSWEGGVQAIFQANPVALLAEDHLGLLPFHVAAFQYCEPSPSMASTACMEREQGQSETRLPHRGVSRAARISERTRREEDVPKIEILFHLLRADPSILDCR